MTAKAALPNKADFWTEFEIRQIALGDLDGDGDLDAWVVHETLEPNSDDSPERNLSDQVWLNDGSGKFMDSGQHFEASRVIALVDLDGDKDLDAISISGGNLTVRKNDGSGHFNNSLQISDRLSAQVILPGDLDQDNDLDVLIASDRQAEIWLNDGQGSIQLSAQRIDLPGNSAVTLGDLNGDGDLDLFCGYPENRYKVWWNDGYGRFGLNWR